MNGHLAGRIASAAAVACLVTVGVTVGALLLPAARAKLGLAPVSHPSYAVGDRIDVSASVYTPSPFTAIVFVRSDCGVCQRIKPWIADLTATLQRRTGVRVVLVASGEHSTDEVSYGAEVGIRRENVYLLAPRALKLQLVPALVLVDQQGVVRYSQEGAPRAQPNQVVDAMTSLILSH